jgi:hypothetical protein
MLMRSRWLIPVAVVGATAGILAAGLIWVLLTRPVATALLMGAAF